MSNLANEPPRKTNHPPLCSLSSPSLFALPYDIVLNVLSRLPKGITQSSVASPRTCGILFARLIFTRLDLYLEKILFISASKLTPNPPWTCHWFTLRRIENNLTENVFASINFPLLPRPCRYSSSVAAVGTEIFFIPSSNIPSSSFWIFDTQSGMVRQGPRMLVNRLSNSVGLVGGKVYVIGGYRDDEIPGESFDLKTQTWEAAPIPEIKGRFNWISSTNLSLDRKVCALFFLGNMISYDTRDGSCEMSELPNDKWWKTGVCVIDNVLYVYYSRFGLMWYDSELMLWRVVYGLDLGKAPSVGMAEYYGKLAFLWEEPSPVCRERKQIMCSMIGLVRSELGIHGTAEPSQLLGIVPHGYRLNHCLSLG